MTRAKINCSTGIWKLDRFLKKANLHFAGLGFSLNQLLHKKPFSIKQMLIRIIQKETRLSNKIC